MQRLNSRSLPPIALAMALGSFCAHAQESPTPAVEATTQDEKTVDEPTAFDETDISVAPRWTGNASVAAVAASGTRDLDDIHGRFGLALRARGEWRQDEWRAMGEIAVGSESLAYDEAPWLRQAWISHTRGPLELRIGRQIIAWGRADRFNPTDNLSPRNLRALVAEIDEDRIGVDAGTIRLRLGERMFLTALHAPSMRATVLPDTIASVPAAFGGRRVSDQSSSLDTNALRIDYSGSALDLSASVVEGPAVTPAFEDATASFGAIKPGQPEVRIVGADFSAALGSSWGLRGEFASTEYRDEAPTGLGDFRYAVLGVERHIDGGWLALAQLIHRRADRSPAAPSIATTLNRAIWFQSEARSDAVYIGLNRAQFEGDLSGNLGVLQTLDDRGRAWFANIAWRASDRLNLLMRWQHFTGPADSNLGALRRDSLLLLELRSTWGAAR